VSVVAIDFIPMTVADLEWVAAQDRLLYPFPWSRQNFIDSMVAGYGCWTLFEDGQRAGYAVLMMVLDEAHILNISVCQARQGCGLGGRMLQHLGDVARAAGATQIFLEVRPSNEAALALYKKVGFEMIGRRKGYYPALNGREDAVVMRHLL